MKSQISPALFLRCARQTALVGVLALSAACSVAGEPPKPAGHELFELCQQCHGEDAGGHSLANAPSIAGLPQWYIEAQLKKFKVGGRGTHFDDLTGMQMRPMAMSLASDDEIKTVAEFVAKLPIQKPAATITDGDALHGKTLYAPCVQCHQADGSGLQKVNAPPLTHTNDWYLVRALQKFKSGVRGSNPMDITGAGMVAQANSLPDEQAIKDVVAYISTLSAPAAAR